MSSPQNRFIDQRTRPWTSSLRRLHPRTASIHERCVSPFIAPVFRKYINFTSRSKIRISVDVTEGSQNIGNGADVVMNVEPLTLPSSLRALFELQGFNAWGKMQTLKVVADRWISKLAVTMASMLDSQSVGMSHKLVLLP